MTHPAEIAFDRAASAFNAELAACRTEFLRIFPAHTTDARAAAAEAFAPLLQRLTIAGDELFGTLINEADGWIGALSPYQQKDARRICSAGLEVERVDEAFSDMAEQLHAESEVAA